MPKNAMVKGTTPFFEDITKKVVVVSQQGFFIGWIFFKIDVNIVFFKR